MQVPHVAWALLDVSSCRLHVILQLIFMLKVKVNVVDLFSASTWNVSEVLRFSMRCQEITQNFYLHTLRFIRKRNEPYLPLPSQPQLVLIYRSWRDGRLSRPWCEVAPAEIRTCNLAIANPTLYHTATSALILQKSFNWHSCCVRCVQTGKTAELRQWSAAESLFSGTVPRHYPAVGRQATFQIQVKVTTYSPTTFSQPISQLAFQLFLGAF